MIYFQFITWKVKEQVRNCSLGILETLSYTTKEIKRKQSLHQLYDIVNIKKRKEKVDNTAHAIYVSRKQLTQLVRRWTSS